MKKVLLLIVLLVSSFSFGQTEEINNYKYLIVPEKFDFLKEADQYNLNTLTKMMFEKYGFEVFFQEGNLPLEVSQNRCNALYGNLIDHSGWFGAGLAIQIKDCQGNVLFTSQTAKNKIKDFKQGYYDALRKASASLDSLNYKYNGKSVAGTAAPVAAAKTNAAPVAATKPAPPVTPVSNSIQLFAQPIENGYQLVDTTPKIVLKMYRTSQPDYYTAMGEGKSGVVFKKDNNWFFEYYLNDKLVSEKLDIKF